jgi:anti-anti-sigma factor
MTSDQGIRTKQVAEHLWVLTAPGERDMADAPALRDQVDHVYAMGSKLVCDLSQTTFIDSTVISVLIYAAGRSQQHPRHGFVIVAPPGSRVRRVLDLVGMSDITTIVGDVEEALDTT